MTVGAAFVSEDDSASLFGGGELCHGNWSHLFDLIFQFFSGNNRKNKKRQSEETYTGAEGDHMCIARPTAQAEFIRRWRVPLECIDVFCSNNSRRGCDGL